MGYRKSAFIAWSPRNLSAQTYPLHVLEAPRSANRALCHTSSPPALSRCYPSRYPATHPPSSWVSRLAAKYLTSLVGAPGLEPGTR